MNTEALKISLAQQILSLSDEFVLKKIDELLNEETIVGYETDGTAVTKQQFIEEMEEVDRQIKAGTLKTYSTAEVRERILGKK